MVKTLRIGFCLPFGMILENTPAWISYQKLTPIQGWNIHKKIAYGSNVGENRNIVCRDDETDLKWQNISSYEKGILVDYDVSFTKTDVEQIISYDYDVVSGLYQYKDQKQVYNYCHAGNWSPEFIGVVDNDRRYLWSDSGIKKCDWIGAGFLCINKRVFEKLPYPWFIHRIIEVQRGPHALRKETMEDIGFSLLCGEHGINIYVDCDIKLQHHIFFSKEKQYLDVIDDLRKRLKQKNSVTSE